MEQNQQMASYPLMFHVTRKRHVIPTRAALVSLAMRWQDFKSGVVNFVGLINEWPKEGPHLVS